MTVSYFIMLVCAAVLGITVSTSFIDGNKVGLIASVAGIAAAMSSVYGV